MEKTDRRTIKTCRAITDAMWDLLKEKKFDAISVRDITEAADINRSTFYLHYEDKYDLMDQMIKELLAKFNDPKPAGTTPFQEMTINHYQNSITNMDQNYRRFKILFSHPDIFDFQAWMADAYFRQARLPHDLSDDKRIDFEFDVNYFTAAITGTIRWWVLNDRPIPADRMAEKLYGIHQQLFFR